MVPFVRVNLGAKALRAVVLGVEVANSKHFLRNIICFL